MRLLLAVVFLVSACSDSLPTAAPQNPDVILQERTDGLTLGPGDAAVANLDGGRYRVGWVTDGCTYFQIAWAPTGIDAIPITVDQPSGEAFVELPAGPGTLDRAADCDYTVRFEVAP